MPLVFHAEVLHCLVDRELRWRGHVLAPWLADGEHSFTIEPRAHDQVRFGQREVFTGVLSWLAGRLIARETRKGFAAMNAALKARVEDARPATSCESCASE
jgi:hypothetical protein